MSISIDSVWAVPGTGDIVYVRFSHDVNLDDVIQGHLVIHHQGSDYYFDEKIDPWSPNRLVMLSLDGGSDEFDVGDAWETTGNQGDGYLVNGDSGPLDPGNGSGYLVEGLHIDGSDGYSQVAEFTDVSDIGAYNVTLNWDFYFGDGIPNQGFGGAQLTIEKSTDGGNTWEYIADLDSSPQQITGLTPSTNYQFRVAASEGYDDTVRYYYVFAYGPAISTYTYSAPPPPPQPLTSGALLSPSNIKTTQLTLTWLAASGGTAPYTYQVQSFDGSNWSNLGSPTSDLGVTVTGLTAYSQYTYRIQTTDSAGTPATVTSNAQTPTTAAALTAGTLSGIASTHSASLTTTVSANGTGTRLYKLQRAPDVAGSPEAYGDVGVAGTATAWTDAGLSPKTAYWYRVVYTDSDGDSVIGAGVQVTTTTSQNSYYYY
jgi:hypothetical protein